MSKVVDEAASTNVSTANVGEEEEEADEHFNRHIENLNKSNDDDDNIIIEEKEELNEFKLDKLIRSNKNKNGANGLAKNSEVQIATNSSQHNDDDDYFLASNDEPKVFQVEEDVVVVASQISNMSIQTQVTRQLLMISSKKSCLARL